MSKFYEFEATNLRGQKVSMSDYKGKVVLVVNTASKCSFTPQYGGLESLYKKYKAQGLEILGFPCNQFGKQEPGGSSDIQEFCQVNYGVSFPMFEKIDVNGENTHPLYSYLKSEKGGLFGNNIKWNFTKFLIDKNGKVVKRYGPIVKPQAIEGKIRSILE